MYLRRFLALCALSPVLVSIAACGDSDSAESTTPIDGVIAEGENRAKELYTAESIQKPIVDQPGAEEVLELVLSLPQDLSTSSGLSSIVYIDDPAPVPALLPEIDPVPPTSATITDATQSSTVINSGVSLVGATVTEKVCSGGGTISENVYRAVEGKWSTGDYSIATFTNCSLGGDLYHGQAAFHLNSMTEEGMSITIAAVDFTKTWGDSLTLNGAFTIESQRDITTGDTSRRFFGKALALTYSYQSFDGTTYSTSARDLMLTDFSQQFSYSSCPLSCSVSYRQEMTVASHSFGNSVRLETTTAFVLNPAVLFPHEGEMTVAGADDHRVKLTAGTDPSGEPNLTVAYDLEGDGIYESSFTRNWN